MRLSALCLAVLIAGASANDAARIAWSKDLATARAQTARDNRPVLLYFTFDT